MSPELINQLVGAIVVAGGAFTAIRAYRATTRATLLNNLLGSVAMLLLVRLVAEFDGWTSWFIYMWMFCLGGYVVAVYLAATVWPKLPWRAESAKARRSETTGLGISSVLTLAVSGALVVPGLMLS